MNKAGKEDFQRGKAVLIAVTHFVHDVYTAFLSPILPLLIKKFSLNYTMASLFFFF